MMHIYIPICYEPFGLKKKLRTFVQYEKMCNRITVKEKTRIEKFNYYSFKKISA